MTLSPPDDLLGGARGQVSKATTGSQWAVGLGQGSRSGLASCLQPLDGLPRGDDRDALEAAHRQEVALVARGDEIGLTGDGRRDDVIVIGIGGHHARHLGG
jgi:hypothetical protein